MQSQLEAMAQTPLKQQAPNRGVVGHAVGAQTAPGVNDHPPGHDDAETVWQIPVHGWQHRPTGGGGGQLTCWHVRPGEKTKGAGHAVAVVIVQFPVAGSQQAPWPGVQTSGEQRAPKIGFPPAAWQSTGSWSVQVLVAGQQQATRLIWAHTALGHEPPAVNCPPICEQTAELVTMHEATPAVFTTQQEPTGFWAHVAVVHGEPGVKGPGLAVRQSHAVAAITHWPLIVQQAPPATHGLGWQVVAVERIVPPQGVPARICEHPPVAVQQMTYTGWGQGLTGLHPPGLGTGVHPVGQAPVALKLHVPVAGSQQTCTGAQGLGLHVCPGTRLVPGGHCVLAKTCVQTPVSGSQQAAEQGLGWQDVPLSHTPLGQLAWVVCVHSVVPGTQQAPVDCGWQNEGVQTAPAVKTPPAMAHTAESTLVHLPQQQHAPGAAPQAGKAPQGWLEENCPPIWAQVPELSTVHTPVEGLQQEPGTSAAHAVGEQAPPGPVNVPPLATQSQLETVEHPPLMQQEPMSAVVGHGLGEQNVAG